MFLTNLFNVISNSFLSMSIFDIAVAIIALVALVNGWRKGLTMQACSIIAVIGGIWLSSAFGADVGAMLPIEARYAKPAGFLVIFFAVLILLAVLSRVIKSLFSAVGLGILDSIFGALISLAKTALILGILCSAFDALNGGGHIIETKKLNNTIFFRPLCRTMEVFDLFDIEKAGKEIKQTVEKTVKSIDV